MNTTLAPHAPPSTSSEYSSSDLLLSGYSATEADFCEAARSAIAKEGSGALSTRAIAEVVGRNRKSTQHQLMRFEGPGLFAQTKCNPDDAMWRLGQGWGKIERFTAPQELDADELPSREVWNKFRFTHSDANIADAIVLELNRARCILPRRILQARVERRLAGTGSESADDSQAVLDGPRRNCRFDRVLLGLVTMGFVRRYDVAQAKTRLRRDQDASATRRRRPSSSFSLVADVVVAARASDSEKGAATRPKQAVDPCRLATIVPQTTNHAAPCCQNIRQIYQVLAEHGPMSRPDLLLQTGLGHKQFAQALSAGRKLATPLWIPKIGSQFPNPEPDVYTANPAGLAAVEKKMQSARPSPIDALNHSERQALCRVAWSRKKAKHHDGKLRGITDHEAWLIACLAAIVKSHPHATIAEIIGAGFPGSKTTLRNTVALAVAIRIMKVTPGRKSERKFDWKAIGRLLQLKSGERPNDLTPQRWLDRFDRGWPTDSPLDKERRQILLAVDFKKTGLTSTQWSRVSALVATIGDEWDKSRNALAKRLGYTEEQLTNNVVPWAVKAGVVTVVPRRGATPAKLVTNWDKLRELAGELPPMANGKATSNGQAKAQKQADTQPAAAAEWTDYLNSGEIVAIFHRSWSAVSRRMRSGEIQAEKAPGKWLWRIRRSDLPRTNGDS